QAIANILNAEEIKKRYGKNLWHAFTIDYVINNERYIGDSLLQKKYTTETFPFEKRLNRGKKQQYYIENSHPPIISRETFDAAQNLQASKNQDCQPQKKYPLTGKIVCNDCGHYFRRMIINETAYWLCGYHVSGRRKCEKIRFSELELQDAFTLLVCKLTANRKEIFSPMICQLEQMQTRHNGIQSKIYEVDRQIAELNQQNLVIARLHTQGILDDADFTAQSNSVNQKVNGLRTKRRRLLADDENDEMIDQIKKLDEILSEINDIQIGFNETLFNDIITKITAVSCTELKFHLIGGLELTETISRRERRCRA
ncbi:MAG: recombinase family protein, partial [Oscillospiraceae bacterium]|nr:recombinase family protein [Oscillospiraceae bacterium]